MTQTDCRALVTGGAGFLGSHLCDALVRRGAEVLCVDNFHTGTRNNITQLFDNPRFELLRHDVTFPLHVEVDRIAMLAAMDTPAEFTGPVNIGNPAELTMLELAELVLRLSGSKSLIVHLSWPPDDLKLRRPDIELATQALGWQPKVPLEDGLKEMIAYFRALLQT